MLRATPRILSAITSSKRKTVDTVGPPSAVDDRLVEGQPKIGDEQVLIGYFPEPTSEGERSYDPKPDGSGFVALDSIAGAELRVVLHWGHELERIAVADGARDISTE